MMQREIDRKWIGYYIKFCFYSGWVIQKGIWYSELGHQVEIVNNQICILWVNKEALYLRPRSRGGNSQNFELLMQICNIFLNSKVLLQSSY